MCAVRLKALLAVSTAALTLGTVAANAGGYIPPVVETGVIAPITQVAPVGDWAGGYAGLTLGYAFGGDDEFGVRDLTNGSITTPGKLELSGVNGGVHVGYRWQKDRWVFGPELGFEGGNVKDEFSFTDVDGDTAYAKSKIKNVLALRMKTGYTVQPDLLVYGIAGVARADVEYRAGATIGGETVSENMDFKKTGYVVGFGAEKKINDKWSITGEYEYANFGKTGRIFGDGESKTEATPDFHNVKLGMNFKF